MNARIKAGSVVTIDGKNYLFQKEFRFSLTSDAIKIIRDCKNNLNNVLNQNPDSPVVIDINLEGSLITLKVKDIILLDEVNSHKIIIPKFSEYKDEKGQIHNLTYNVVLNFDNKKAVKILNLVNLYNNYGEESFVDLQIPDIGNIQIHIKFFLLSTDHISPIDTNKVFIDESTPIKQIIDYGQDTLGNKDIATIPAKINFIASPDIEMPFEKLISVKQGTPIPDIDIIKSFQIGDTKYQFNIYDVKLTN